MKRNALLLIPLVVVLISCGSSSSIPNRETVNKLKELLSKQDLSEFYTKTVNVVYSKEYDVLDIEKDGEEITTSYFNYLGVGLFGFYYDLSKDQYDSIVDENGDIDTFDAISTGLGSYGIMQVSRTMYFNREGSSEATINNLDISQNITLKTVEQDLWVDNSLLVSDDGIFQYETRQEFSAIINRELLFNSVSTRTFRDIFSKVDLFDTPGNVEHLDKLYFSICRDLANKSDKQISNFIKANQVSIQEEDNNVEVSFVYTNEDLEEEEMDYIFPGAIKGTLYFDKETYQFLNFEYEMVYQVETYDRETGSIKVINTKFTCSGESTREIPHDTVEPINPTIYDDVAQFLEDVNENVVPPSIVI